VQLPLCPSETWRTIVARTEPSLDVGLLTIVHWRLVCTPPLEGHQMVVTVTLWRVELRIHSQFNPIIMGRNGLQL
jgi:hypothetical protein